MVVSGQLHALSVLPSEEVVFGPYLVRSWVGLRACLGAVAEKQTSQTSTIEHRIVLFAA
jgi:hypothetical protein